MEPWTIYIWKNGDKIEGAAKALNSIYTQGWEIEFDENVKRNEDKHKEWRAKTHTKNALNNTLNVLNWYGKKILDANGDIDTERLARAESSLAYQVAKDNEAIRRLNLTSKKKLASIDMNDILPIKKFPKKEITLKQAQEYGLL